MNEEQALFERFEMLGRSFQTLKFSIKHSASIVQNPGLKYFDKDIEAFAEVSDNLSETMMVLINEHAQLVQDTIKFAHARRV